MCVCRCDSRRRCEPFRHTCMCYRETRIPCFARASAHFLFFFSVSVLARLCASLCAFVRVRARCVTCRGRPAAARKELSVFFVYVAGGPGRRRTLYRLRNSSHRPYFLSPRVSPARMLPALWPPLMPARSNSEVALGLGKHTSRPGRRSLTYYTVCFLLKKLPFPLTSAFN